MANIVGETTEQIILSCLRDVQHAQAVVVTAILRWKIFWPRLIWV